MSVDPNADWLARSTAAGVVVAEGFDTIDHWAALSRNEPPCNPAYQVTVGGKLCGCRANAWDANVKASGAGSVRFDILSQSVQGGGGDVVVPFGDYATSQFGAGDDMWVSWRQRMDARFIAGYEAQGGGFANAKQVIIAQGDMPGIKANACSEAELVIVSSNPAYQPCYPTGYIECGTYTAFTQRLKAGQYLGNAGGSSVWTQQNAQVDGAGLYRCLSFPPTLDRSGCFTYVADEWITYMVHVQLGQQGTAISSVTNSLKLGMTDSTYEFYAAYPGQDFVLLHRQTQVVVPRGQHYIGGDPALLSSYKGGWTPGSAHPQAKYGNLWLTPYMTNKDPTQVTPTASTWYDEIIVSRQRIAAPGRTVVVPVPTPAPSPSPMTYTFSQIGSPLAPLVDATSWITQYKTVAPTSIRDITMAWNGAAFDYASGTMHIPVPGGHTDSWINQSFACDVASGTWRVTDGQTAFPPDQHVSGYAPTYDDAGTQPTLGTGYLADGKTPVTPHVNHAIQYFDGKPASRHIYGGSCWLPTQQRVFLVSGSNWQSGAGDWFVGHFDPVAGKWERKGNAPLSYDGISSAYDSVRDVVYWNRSGTMFVYAYDPATDTHTKIGTKAGDPLDSDFGPQVQICCDGACDYLYATIYKGWLARSPTLPPIYGSAVVRMKLGQSGLQTWEPVAVTGDTSILYSMSPGMEYDPDLNALVFWSHQFPGSLGILDLTTFALTTIPIAGTGPTTTELADTSSGVWGRFRRVSTGVYTVMVSANAPLYRITSF